MLEVELSNGSPYSGHCKPDVLATIMMALLGFEALLFGLFTTCMACDQVYSITTSSTYIDRLKAGEKKRKVAWCSGRFFENIKEVVGDADDSLLRALLPLPPRWKDKERVLGFTVPGTHRGHVSSLQILSGNTAEELMEP